MMIERFIFRTALSRAFLSFAMTLLVAVTLPSGVEATTCRDDLVELRGPWGQARFTVEIADTDALRARGLMFRENLPRSAGMLFLYDRPSSPQFWMQNTLIPLDMLFFDAAGALTRLHHDAVPHDRTSIDGGSGVIAVLEINGGLARLLGITEDTEMRNPRMDQASALWPCP